MAQKSRRRGWLSGWFFFLFVRNDEQRKKTTFFLKEEVTSINRFNSLPLCSVCGHCHGYMLAYSTAQRLGEGKVLAKVVSRHFDDASPINKNQQITSSDSLTFSKRRNNNIGKATRESELHGDEIEHSTVASRCRCVDVAKSRAISTATSSKMLFVTQLPMFSARCSSSKQKKTAFGVWLA